MMKTEQEIVNGIEKVKASMGAEFHKAMRQLEDEDFDDCAETLFTIMSNVLALEGAKRIIK